ncbi:MAG: hypothetical protein QM598_07390 [Protaetiibacter sp.]
MATVEHLVAIAAQARAENIECCYLDAVGYLDAADGASAGVDLALGSLVTVSTPRELARHLRASRSRAVFVQSPYPEHYPEWFWPLVYDRTLAFTGYGLTLSTWEHGLYGLETFRRARHLLADSPLVAAKYAEHGVDPSRVFMTGNPLLWELRRREQSHDSQVDRLLWAPHWTATWFDEPRGFARWRETVRVVDAYAAGRPDAAITVRPHPLLLETIANDSDDDDIHAFRTLLGRPNVTLSSASMLDDIHASSRLLTDGVSIIAYYASTGRPLGIVRDADSPRFNTTGEQLVAAADELATPRAVAEWLEAPTPDLDEGRRELSRRLHPTMPDAPISVWARQVGL